MAGCRTQSLTDEMIAEINATHLAVTSLKPADLLFVFGTREDVALRVAEASRLWRERFLSLGDRERRRDAGSAIVRMHDHQGRHGRTRDSV